MLANYYRNRLVSIACDRLRTHDFTIDITAEQLKYKMNKTALQLDEEKSALGTIMFETLLDDRNFAQNQCGLTITTLQLTGTCLKEDAVKIAEYATPKTFAIHNNQSGFYMFEVTDSKKPNLIKTISQLHNELINTQGKPRQ